MNRRHTSMGLLVAMCLLILAGCASFRTENPQRDLLERIARTMPPVLDGRVRYASPCVELNIDCTDVGWNAVVTSDESLGQACQVFNEWGAENGADVQYLTDRDKGLLPGSISASHLVDEAPDTKRPYQTRYFAGECRKALRDGGFAALQGSIRPVAQSLGLDEQMEELALSDLYTAALMWDENTRKATANVRVVG